MSDLKELGIKVDSGVVEREAHRPVGGQLQFFRHNWEQISRDPWILETILGCRLEFSDSPYQRKELTQVPLSKEKAQALDGELEKMAMKQAIEPVRDRSQATFVSPMFMVTKAYGSWRPVINLKCLNQHILARHFKMESIKTAKGLLRRGDWMIKLDLKDAYLLVPLYDKYDMPLLCQCTDNTSILQNSTYINIICVKEGLSVVCMRGPS